jgi:hypothetical protein
MIITPRERKRRDASKEGMNVGEMADWINDNGELSELFDEHYLCRDCRWKGECPGLGSRGCQRRNR